MLRTSLIAAAIVLVVLACGKESGLSSGYNMPGTGKAGSLARFAISGNYLYALDGRDLVCFDISTGSSPVLKKRIPIMFDIETIYPYQDKLFIGSQQAMYAYSLADPANPTQLSAVTHVRGCDPVVAQGNYAYVTIRTGTQCGGADQLMVYNVADISKPQLLKTIPMPRPFGLGLSSNTLYVTNTNGVRLFDITQPDNPVSGIEIPEAGAQDVIPYNNTLLVQLTKGTSLYDISNPSSPAYLSRIDK